MADSGTRLHAAIDAISADVARLKAVQSRKRDLKPGDPHGSVLAEQAVDIATQLVPKTVAEREIVDDMAGD